MIHSWYIYPFMFLLVLVYCYTKLYAESTHKNKNNISQYRVELQHALGDTLSTIEKNDQTYHVRYPLIFKAMYLASQLGYKTFQKEDPDDKDYYILYIDLPICGEETKKAQCSWHMPKNTSQWDNPTTEEKYRRCREYNFYYGSTTF